METVLANLDPGFSVKTKIRSEDSIPNTIDINRVERLMYSQNWGTTTICEFMGNKVSYSARALLTDGTYKYGLIGYLQTHKTISKKTLNNLAFVFNVTPEYLTDESDNSFKTFSGTIINDYTKCYVVSQKVTNSLDENFSKRYHIPMHIVDWLKSGERLVSEGIARKMVCWYMRPTLDKKHALSQDSDEVSEAMNKYVRKLEYNKALNKRDDKSIITGRILNLCKLYKVSTWLIVQLASIDQPCEGFISSSKLGTRGLLGEYIHEQWTYEGNGIAFINNIAWVLNVDVEYLLGNSDDYTKPFSGVRTVGKYSDYLIDLKNVTNKITIPRSKYTFPDYIVDWLQSDVHRVSKDLFKTIVRSVMGSNWYRSVYEKHGYLPNWAIHLDITDGEHETEPPMQHNPKAIVSENTMTQVPIKYSDTLSDIVNNHLPGLSDTDISKLKDILNSSDSGMHLTTIPDANDVIIHAEDYDKKDVIAMQKALDVVNPPEKSEPTRSSIITDLGKMSNDDRNYIFSKFIKPHKDKTPQEIISEIHINEFIDMYLPTLTEEDINALRCALNILDPPNPVEVPITLSGITKDFIPNAPYTELADLYIELNHKLPKKFKSRGMTVPTAVKDLLECITSSECSETIDGINNISENYYRSINQVTLKDAITDLIDMDQKEFKLLKNAIISVSSPSYLKDLENKDLSKDSIESVTDDFHDNNEIIKVFVIPIGAPQTEVNNYLREYPDHKIKFINSITMTDKDNVLNQVLTVVLTK